MSEPVIRNIVHVKIMKETIEINTGEVKASKSNSILTSNAIGSCVAITAYDARKKIGALAHVMFPGKSPENAIFPRTRYAADAIEAMIEEMAGAGANAGDIEACLVGGSNVLKRDDVAVWQDNIESIVKILKGRGIPVRARALGGTNRKSVSLDIGNGIVRCAEADQPEEVLWQAGETDRVAMMDDPETTKGRPNGGGAEMDRQATALDGSGNHGKKLAELEDVQRASLSIIRDLEDGRKQLEATRNAYINIVEDMEEKNKDLEQTKTALLNLFQDLEEAKGETEVLNKTLEERVEKRTRELQDSTMQLIQAEKLGALGELTAGVAHELKQPLNSIKIISQSILRDIAKRRFDEQSARDDLPEIIHQVDKMAEIIDHMRVFTRRPIDVPNEMVDLNLVIGNALKFVGQQLKDHNVDVVMELDSALPQVLGDSVRLEQVIVNLITNARHAVEESGKEDKRIEVRTGKGSDGQTVSVEVKDNGVGIPEEAKKKIFQPFFTTKEPGKGTGLGLSVSKKILDEHKGTLEFFSNAGEGTLFRLLIPVKHNVA
jgi:signal transduction histidine kinase/chemotaxis receptor (MCP) glutamine deamidase CheD